MEKRSTRSTINSTTLPLSGTEEQVDTSPLPFSGPGEQDAIKKHDRALEITINSRKHGKFNIWLSYICLSFDDRIDPCSSPYKLLLFNLFLTNNQNAIRKAFEVHQSYTREGPRTAENESQTSPVDTCDKETNTHIVWKIPPKTKINSTQTMKEKDKGKTAFSQTPVSMTEEKKTQTQRTTSEEKKTQTETKNKKEKPHKAANTQTTNIETKEKKIQTTNVHMNEPQQSNEFDNILDQVSRELEAVPLSPIPATPPRPPTTTTTTTASTSECQPTPPPTAKQGEKKKRRRPPPHIRRQQQCPRQQPQQHRGQQQQQHWQYQEQHYPSWGYFNHPMADLIQLLLDHLYWPPAPTIKHPNGHRGQPRQQQQQRHQ